MSEEQQIEQQIEQDLIAKLQDLKYNYRPDICDKLSRDVNFRQKFQELNKVKLTDGEFSRLLDDIITPDVFNTARLVRGINDFERDDGTPTHPV